MIQIRKWARRWWRWLALALGMALGMALLFVLLTSVRFYLVLRNAKPWIEPLPGVCTEPSRPFVKASDLGPATAFKLFLQAVAEPEGAHLPADSCRVWSRDWSEALTKLAVHRWPKTPPPPAPQPNDGAMQDPEFAPLFDADGSEIEGPTLGLPAEHPALQPEAPWTLEQCRDVQRLVGLHEPKLELLDRALTAPDPQMPTVDSFSFLLPYMADAQELVGWLAISAQYRAATGDYAGCFRDLDRAARMGNLVCRGGSLVEYLVGFKCQAVAADAAWMVARREDIPPELLIQAARRFLRVLDDAEPFVEAMRLEPLPVMNAIAEVYVNPDLLDTYDGKHEESGRLAEIRRASRRLVFRLRGSTLETTTANLRSAYQHLVAIAEQPYSLAVSEAYGDFIARLDESAMRQYRGAARVRDPIGLMAALTFMPPLGTAHRKVAGRDARLRGMALFLAIQAYEKKHGALPERLDQLVPGYLPRVPEDPFDGKPFRYLRNGVPGLPGHAWAVYSIGEDFTDDGGKAHSAGTPDNDHGPNPDLVWPSLEYPELRPTPQDR